MYFSILFSLFSTLLIFLNWKDDFDCRIIKCNSFSHTIFGALHIFPFLYEKEHFLMKSRSFDSCYFFFSFFSSLSSHLFKGGKYFWITWHLLIILINDVEKLLPSSIQSRRKLNAQCTKVSWLRTLFIENTRNINW